MAGGFARQILLRAFADQDRDTGPNHEKPALVLSRPIMLTPAIKNIYSENKLRLTADFGGARTAPMASPYVVVMIMDYASASSRSFLKRVAGPFPGTIFGDEDAVNPRAIRLPRARAPVAGKVYVFAERTGNSISIEIRGERSHTLFKRLIENY